METTTIIVFSAVAVMFAVLYLLNRERKNRQDLEKQLYYYDRQRYYRQERQKIIEHHCIQHMQGKVDLKTTLQKLENDLSAHSGGDNDWRQEYRSVQKILLAQQEKAS